MAPPFDPHSATDASLSLFELPVRFRRDAANCFDNGNNRPCAIPSLKILTQIFIKFLLS
ncbi:hypothetical protein BCAR13_60241 [Paraburkholderia caribensis]|nr:hypothetical protein BCAR13_60241 [Paraburkholderia caribensis]